MTEQQPFTRLAEGSLDEQPDATVDSASLRVLLVEDDAAFAGRVAAFLEEQYGMTIEIEPSGQAALERIKSLPAANTRSQARTNNSLTADSTAKSAREPTTDLSWSLLGDLTTDASGRQDETSAGAEGIDCVVSAYQMPDVDGIDLLDAIQDAVPGLPVMLLAEEGGETAVSEALHRGIDDYLRKDTNVEQFQLLATRIQAVVTRYRHAVTLRTFSNAVEHAGHSIYITDSNGTIQYVNSAFEDITGYTAEEALGQEPSLFNSGVHSEEFYSDLWDTITDGEVWENEIVNERKNGERYVVEQTIAPITSWKGDIEYFVAINNDISELKRRTEELERQNKRLEEFTQTLSHDLQSPLNVAQGRLELAQQTGDEEQFELVRRSLDRMETILEDSLALAQQGQTVTDAEPVPLRDVIWRAWNHVVTDTATLNCDVSEEVVVTMDESRVCNLFENLFRNAIDHAGTSVNIHVGVLDSIPGFYVADDGPGIPEDDRDIVFETGYTTESDGTGFGLAIVREIAAAHDWGITLEDSTTGGARFEFTVPAGDWRESTR